MPANDRLYRRYIHKFRLHLPNVNFKDQRVVWWLITVGYVCGIVLFFTSPLMRIRTLTCTTNNQTACPDYILPAFSRLKGKLNYLQDLTAIARQIKGVVPTAVVNVSRLWPNTIAIQIAYPYDVANLQIPASSSALLVSSRHLISGMLVTPNSNLPTIIASAAASLAVGDSVTETGLVAAVDLAAKLPTAQTITVLSPLEIRVIDRSTNQYLFTANKPITAQLDALQVILGATTINTTHQTYDVRYDRPILKKSW